MGSTDGELCGPIRLRWYVACLAVLWTLAVGVVVVWHLVDAEQQVLEIARGEARGLYENDILFRRWAAGHGGVYVPVTETTPPNRYLTAVPERDIVTPSGRPLTLVNPAYMTRQIHEMAREQFGLRGHITSLHPINPENAPDAWETGSLVRLEEGAAEVSELEEIEGHWYMRLMRPVAMEASCLKCHAREGRQLGEVAGGISVAVPMRPLWAAHGPNALHRAAGYGTLWLVGMAGIFSTWRRLRRQVERRLQAERELQAAQRALAQRAAQERLLAIEHREKERAQAELERLRAQVVRQTQLATIGQLSASIAHELRNPLGVIRNAAYLLGRKAPKEEDRLRKYLTIIEEETAAADQIITELMAMTRGQAPRKEPVELRRLVQDALGRMRLPESVRWRSECLPDPFVVHADPSQLGQVIRNLFVNSVQAMGGSGEITLAARRNDAFDEITVADTGPGIPPDVRRQVFEPLFTTKSKGTGMGLAICRQIVERHGGTLEALDNDGGAVFHIRLPRSEAGS